MRGHKSQLWENIDREEQLLNKASKKRKKSTGRKGPRKMPKQASLVESVECAPEGLAQALASQMNVRSVAQARTVNKPAGSWSMEGLEGEQEPNEREPSDSASSA